MNIIPGPGPGPGPGPYGSHITLENLDNRLHAIEYLRSNNHTLNERVSAIEQALGAYRTFGGKRRKTKKQKKTKKKR